MKNRVGRPKHAVDNTTLSLVVSIYPLQSDRVEEMALVLNTSASKVVRDAIDRYYAQLNGRVNP